MTSGIATVDWGDGTVNTSNTHTYTVSGIKTVTISGTIGDLRFNNGGDKLKILDVSNWGTFDVSGSNVFYGCANLTISASDAPIISGTDLARTLSTCTSLSTENLNNWDVSSVTNMGSFFNGSSFNGYIGDWDVSNVIDMGSLFRSSPFNQDISNWDTSSVTKVRAMFFLAGNFDQDISGFQISQVTDFNSFMIGAGLSTANYDALLIAWDAQGAMSFSGTVNFGSSTYTLGSAAETARTSLISKWGGISDGGGV
jgi:hypothetical protein